MENISPLQIMMSPATEKAPSKTSQEGGNRDDRENNLATSLSTLLSTFLRKNNDDDENRKKDTPNFQTLMGGAIHCSWCKRPMTHSEAQHIIERNDGRVICDSCLVNPCYNYDKPPDYNWKFTVYCQSRAEKQKRWWSFQGDWANDFFLYRTSQLATPPRRQPGERGICDMMAELTARDQYEELTRKQEVLDKIKKEIIDEDGLQIETTVFDEVKGAVLENSNALKARCSQALNTLNESEPHSFEINDTLNELITIITLLQRVDYFSLLIKHLSTTATGTLCCASEYQLLKLLQSTVNSIVSKDIIQHYPETTFHFLSRCIDCQIISNCCEFLGYRLKNLVYKTPWYNPEQFAKVDKTLVLEGTEKFETWIHHQALTDFDKTLMDGKIFLQITLLKCSFIRNSRTELDIDKFKKRLECLLDISNTEHSDEYREHLKRIASSHQGGHTVPDFRIHHKLMAKDISEDTYAKFMYDHQIVLHIAQLPRYSEYPECLKAMCKELAEHLSLSTELNQIIDGQFDAVIASQNESADVFYLKAIAYQHAQVYPGQKGLAAYYYEQACERDPLYYLEFAIYLDQQPTKQRRLILSVLNKAKEHIDDEDYLLWHHLYSSYLDPD